MNVLIFISKITLLSLSWNRLHEWSLILCDRLIQMYYIEYAMLSCNFIAYVWERRRRIKWSLFIIFYIQSISCLFESNMKFLIISTLTFCFMISGSDQLMFLVSCYTINTVSSLIYWTNTLLNLEECGMHHSKSTSCMLSVPKWTYNIDTDRCLLFAYGGCEGNENRFDSEWECKAICINWHT